MMIEYVIVSEDATSLSHKVVTVLVLYQSIVKVSKVRLVLDEALAIDESSLIGYWSDGEVASDDQVLYFAARLDQGRPINANAATTIPQLGELVQELADRLATLEKLLLR